MRYIVLFRALNRAPTVPNPALHRADPTLLAENSQNMIGKVQLGKERGIEREQGQSDQHGEGETEKAAQ